MASSNVIYTTPEELLRDYGIEITPLNDISILLSREVNKVTLYKLEDKINSVEKIFKVDKNTKHISIQHNDKKFIISLTGEPYIGLSSYASAFTYTHFDLTHAQAELSALNDQLNCIDYNLTLDYLYAFPPNSEVEIGFGNISYIYLCVFKNNQCISNISLEVELDQHKIIINSKTLIAHEGKKLNKMLRSVIIMIANLISPEITIVQSMSINPTSSYLLIKDYDVVIKGVGYNEHTGEDLSIPIEKPEVINREIIKGLHTSYVAIEIDIDVTNPINIENARRVFSEVVASFECEKRTRGGRTRGGRTRKIGKKSKKTITRRKSKTR